MLANSSQVLLKHAELDSWDPEGHRSAHHAWQVAFLAVSMHGGRLLPTFLGLKTPMGLAGLLQASTVQRVRWQC